MSINRLWVEKYRPKSLDEVIFQDEAQKQKFMNYRESKEFPHLLLSGVQGSGKTSISRALIRDLGVNKVDVQYVNASDETGIEAMRDKIKNFVSSMPIGSFKVVRLEEADNLSLSAQGMLRAVIEDFSDSARFILTCNYDNKIMPAIKSRLTHHRFVSPAIEEVILRAADILFTENIEFEPEDLEKVVNIFYPDIRSVISYLEDNTSTGKLVLNSASDGNYDFRFSVLELVEKRKFNELRNFVRTNVAKEDYEELFKVIYEGLKKAYTASPEKLEEAIITLNEFHAKHGIVALVDLNMEAALISLGRI